ncbi:MAG TPA: tyrosinase family protein [Longimicrobium sp.]|nr:tyrosinase family protein [Longimicrobium sp.]
MLYVPRTRREFLQQLAAAGVVLGVGGSLGGCGPILQAIQNRPVRRNIADLAPNDPIIDAYKAAVTAMKALPTTDGRNWTRQAQIHLDHCPHGNWFFLPWHRAYLFYFEKICRALSGYEPFALPYWNWTTSREIPAVFWGGPSNPLFNGTRWATPTSQADLWYIGAPVIEGILNIANFEVFASGPSPTQRGASTTGELEGTPHNNIHGFVGGDMGTYMSPLDPVFWTHHNMIDCLWVDWNITRGHPNTSDPNWVNFAFNGNFFDIDGSPANIDVLTTLLMPLFTYRCQDVVLTQAQEASTEAFLRRGAPSRLETLFHAEQGQGVDVVVGRPATVRVTAPAQRLTAAAERPEQERVLLTLRGIQAPVQEDFFVRVFVGSGEVGQQTPEDDPRFVGALGFFEDERHPHERTFVLDITDELEGLARSNRLAGDQAVAVSFVAVPHENRQVRENRTRIGAVELAVVRAPAPETRRDPQRR